MTATSPHPGGIVLVRQRRYLVEKVTSSASPGEATLVDLSCLDDDAQGEPLSVLWEHELDARVLEEDGWSAVTEKGFDEPALFAAYLRTSPLATVGKLVRVHRLHEVVAVPGFTRFEAIALDCGYPASSLRERVYAEDGGCGILIYTGSSDSEGTLGGLSPLTCAGRRPVVLQHPVCAQHAPNSRLEGRMLRGAACHGCLSSDFRQFGNSKK